MGCSLFYPDSHFPKKMAKAYDPWIGQDVNKLLMNWGSPTKTFKMPNNTQTIYTYVFAGSTVLTENSSTAGGCEFNWFVNNDTGLIDRYAYKGDCNITREDDL